FEDETALVTRDEHRRICDRHREGAVAGPHAEQVDQIATTGARHRGGEPGAGDLDRPGRGAELVGNARGMRIALRRWERRQQARRCEERARAGEEQASARQPSRADRQRWEHPTTANPARYDVPETRSVTCTCASSQRTAMSSIG